MIEEINSKEYNHHLSLLIDELIYKDNHYLIKSEFIHKKSSWSCIPTYKSLGSEGFIRGLFNQIFSTDLNEFYLLYLSSDENGPMGFKVSRETDIDEFIDFCNLTYFIGYLVTDWNANFAILSLEDESIASGTRAFLEGVFNHSLEKEVDIFKDSEIFKKSDKIAYYRDKKSHWLNLIEKYVVLRND